MFIVKEKTIKYSDLPILKDNKSFNPSLSDYVFLASDSDILNSFLYHKFISDFDKNKIQMIILNKDLYEMYKSKNYSVINLFDSTKNEIVDTIRS